MEKKLIAAMMSWVIMTGAFAGCSGNSDNKSSSQSKAESSQAEQSESKAEESKAEESKTAEPAGDEKYGIVIKVLSSEFWQSMKAGIEEKAEELGVEVEVLAANSEDDVEGQVTVFETMIQSVEYNAFGVEPTSDFNIVNAVSEENKAGILDANVCD